MLVCLNNVKKENFLSFFLFIVIYYYVFLGDSITFIYNLNDVFKNENIVNSGVSGNRVENILDNLYDRVYRYNPSDVIILVGVNNFLYENSSSDYVTKSIKKIVSEIHKKLPNCNIYIQSIYPVDKKVNEEHMKDEFPNKKILDTNKKLKKYCKENNITYVNVHDSLVNKDGYLDNKYTNDGLHPNEKGYEIITKIIKKEVFKEKKNN